MSGTSAPPTLDAAGPSPRSPPPPAPSSGSRPADVPASFRGGPSIDLPKTGAASAAAAAGNRFRRSGRVSRGLALAVGAMAALVLVGWGVDSTVLTSVLPGQIRMNPATAVCFLLSALSLWLISPSAHRPWRDRPAVGRAAVAAAVAAGAVGLARILGTAVRAAAGHDALRLDRLLFPSLLGQNQMAPNTAGGFVLIAAALLLTIWRPTARRRIGPVLALATGAIGLLAVTGYVYGVDQLYQGWGNSGWATMRMALNTAVCFILLSGGVLAARPDRPPVATILSDTVGGVIARRLLPAAILMPLLVGWLRLKGEQLGLYNSAVGVSLYTLATIAIFVLLIWWNTRYLHKLDLVRWETDERLRQAEAVYESLVETLPQKILRKDLAGRFTFGNQNFCEELKRPLDQIVGRTDEDFFGPMLAERYRKDDRNVIETGVTLDTVEEHVAPGGAKMYVQVMKTPVRDADGRVIGVQGIFWDVTDRKLAEQKLEQTNQKLLEANEMLKASVQSEREAYVALKQAQLQLVQSEKLAGLGQMVAGVAHEINNPLSFVSNNVAVLQRDLKAIIELLGLYRQGEPALAEARPDLMASVRDLSDAVDLNYTLDNLQQLLTRSRDGLKRIQQIVKDLRDFARLDEGDRQDADLNAGVDSTLNIVHGHAKKKRVTIDKQLGPLPLVSCFAAKINQVVMNLVVNAIDASHEGGKVTVRTYADQEPEPAADGAAGPGAAGPGAAPSSRRVVRLEVADEGTGINPAVLERIFDPFFTTKPPGQGTGLGLSISYGIVRDHGGRIDVDTAAGKGSTFRVTLPVGGGA